MTEESVPDARSARRLGGDLAATLVLAFAWSAEIAARFGGEAGVVPTLVGALGCTALTLGAVAAVARSRQTPKLGLEALVVGTLLSSGPTALVGTVLSERTHHRALGGVTFALIASATVVLGFLVTRAVLALPLRRPLWRLCRRLCLTILVVGSVTAVLRPTFSEFGPVGSTSGRFLAQDLAVGLGLAAVLVTRPDHPLLRRVAYPLALVWALAVACGVTVLAGNMRLRVVLAERAPVALGLLGAL